MANYYDENSKEFIDSTINCDMDNAYNIFYKYLPSEACILDAGCGSGRDSLQFLNSGFDVKAFDLSEKMVEATSKLTGLEVMQKGFLDIDEKDCFDAIWASASLLHLDREDLPLAFEKLHKALKLNGIMFCSFKLRDKDFSKGKRSFTCFTEESFRSLMLELNLFEILEIYSSFDGREDRKDEKWLSAIIKKL